MNIVLQIVHSLDNTRPFYGLTVVKKLQSFIYSKLKGECNSGIELDFRSCATWTEMGTVPIITQISKLTGQNKPFYSDMDFTFTFRRCENSSMSNLLSLSFSVNEPYKTLSEL